MLKKSEFIDVHADWLSRFTWDWFGTLTFPGYPSATTAKRKFNHWIRELRREIGGEKFRYASVIERGANKDNVHFHVLIGGIKRRHKGTPYVWKQRWQEIAGLAVLSTYEANRGGMRYLLKSLLPDRDIDLEIEFGKK